MLDRELYCPMTAELERQPPVGVDFFSDRYIGYQKDVILTRERILDYEGMALLTPEVVTDPPDSTPDKK